MTINEAAVEILKEKIKPLGSTEIATVALNRKLISSNSKIPVRSLAYTIEKNIREGIYNTPKLVFIHTSQGRMIGLPEWENNSLIEDLQISKSNFQKITISIPTNIIENIKLAHQARIADTFEETLIYILNEGISKITHIIRENINKQLEGLNDIPQNFTLPNPQNRTKTISRSFDHRELGRKGYEQVEDYLIPVIRLMRQGMNYNEAVHKIAEKLDVRPATVRSQCTRQLGISTNDFIKFVGTGYILNFLKQKYPDKSNKINRELGILY